jgi:hypothetical protein
MLSKFGIDQATGSRAMKAPQTLETASWSARREELLFVWLVDGVA